MWEDPIHGARSKCLLQHLKKTGDCFPIIIHCVCCCMYIDDKRLDLKPTHICDWTKPREC